MGASNNGSNLSRTPAGLTQGQQPALSLGWRRGAMPEGCVVVVVNTSAQAAPMTCPGEGPPHTNLSQAASQGRHHTCLAICKHYQQLGMALGAEVAID